MDQDGPRDDNVHGVWDKYSFALSLTGPIRPGVTIDPDVTRGEFDSLGPTTIQVNQTLFDSL